MRGACESCGAATNKGRTLCYACKPSDRQTPLPPGYIPPSARGTCSRCGKTVRLGPDSTAEPVCHPCRREEPQRKSYGDPRERERACELCMEPYVVAFPGSAKRFCSIQCANAWNGGYRPPYTRAAAAAQRRTRKLAESRARRLRHAQTWDGISDEEILERDGWRCQIPGCKRRPIRKDLKYPHPRSKSIDHIVPLSLGGDDTAVNKRAAHLGCNVARGNKAGFEQVALFGVIREPVPLAGRAS